MSSPGHSILLVEDDASIRRFLRISLEAHGFRVHEARRGSEGLALCAELVPDLVVLDLGLPDIDGQVLIPRLRDWVSVPIIVLSVRSEEREKVAALDAGANDYVTKPFGISELLARVRALLRDRTDGATQEPVYSVDGLRVDLPGRQVWVEGREVRLSRKEYELLRLFVTSPGRVLTHQQILSRVWPSGRGAGTQHLRVLVGALRQKLGDDPTRPRFIATEQGVGYRFKGGR